MIFFRRKQDLLEHYSLFSLVGDKLMNHSLTLTTYNVLFEVCSLPLFSNPLETRAIRVCPLITQRGLEHVIYGNFFLS